MSSHAKLNIISYLLDLSQSCNLRFSIAPRRPCYGWVVKKQMRALAHRTLTILRSDWPLILGVATAAALVGSALVVASEWRDVILGVVAATFLILFSLERVRARRRMARLATQLDSVGTLDKLEVSTDPSVAALDEALNAAIQRTREQALNAPANRETASADAEEPDGIPRSVAVLALGLGDHDQSSTSPETMAQLRRIADTVVDVAERRSALLQMQGSGTFALIFAAFSQEPAARSAKAALDAAAELRAAHPDLHFGLSSGTGLPCRLPGAGYTVIGSPLEEAIRLHRLSASWHEYRLLCPEPVALLLRPYASGARTPLQLTAPNAPPLPIYTLEVVPELIALGA